VHYHVRTGSPAYLPDGNAYCSTLAQARYIARWEAECWRQDEAYRVRGNARDGYEVYDRDADELFVTITIQPCSEHDCSDDE